MDFRIYWKPNCQHSTNIIMNYNNSKVSNLNYHLFFRLKNEELTWVHLEAHLSSCQAKIAILASDYLDVQQKIAENEGG